MGVCSNKKEELEASEAAMSVSKLTVAFCTYAVSHAPRGLHPTDYDILNIEDLQEAGLVHAEARNPRPITRRAAELADHGGASTP